jgi:hypothetical protein
MQSGQQNKILTLSQSSFILVQLYFYSARRPLPFRRYFPGIPATCMTKINQFINQFKVYI